MEDIDKYIGIVHRFGQSDFNGCDCFGLCKLFYREHCWPQKFDDGKPYPSPDNYSEPSQWHRLYKYLLCNFKQVNAEELRFGDFVVFQIEGSIHCGIYLEYGKLLSMQVPSVDGESTSTIYHRAVWLKFFKYGFRRKE